MFKNFGSLAKAKAEDEPVSWQELFEPPDTDKYLQEAAARKKAAKQREQALAQALNGGAGTSESSRANDNDFSAPSGSNSDRPTPRPRTSIGTSGTSSGTGFTGFLSKAPAPSASVVSTDSGAHSSSSGDGFRGFGGKSAPDPFAVLEEEAAAAAPPPPPAAPAPEKPVAAPAPACSGFGTVSGGFGSFGGSAMFAGLSASPPRPSGIVGFDDFGGKSAPEPVFDDGYSPIKERPTEKPAPGSFGSGGPGVARMFRAAMSDSVRTRSDTISSPKATVAPTTTNTFTGFAALKKSTDTGVTGFGASPAVPAPAASTTSTITGFTGFGTANKSADSGFARFGAGAAPVPASSTVAAQSGFTGFGVGKKSTETGFGAGAPAVKNTFSGFGAKKATEATSSSFSGFGVKRNGEITAEPAKPEASASTNTFTGFGSVKKTPEAPTTAAAPTVTGFTGFGTAQKPTETPAKPTVPASTSGFTGFGTAQKTLEAPPTVPAPTGFSGFGTMQKAPEVTYVAAPAATGFTGFGTAQKVAETTTPAPTSGFSGFGTTTTTGTVAGTGTAPGTGTASSVGMVQRDFGTLHVSGPAHILAALEENERRKAGEKAMIKEEVVEPEPAVERPQPAPRRRVRFEDDVQAAPVKAEVDEKSEIKEEEESEDAEDETDDDGPPDPPRYPWGKRPCFRAMLAGGKKLVLANPSRVISDHFVDHVYRSYGCTYDNATNRFYATSPGERGRGNGQVIAVFGNISVEKSIVVASGLVEPAAIAVYEPGLSVCVVTGRGIFVFTEQLDDKGNATGSFLSRQISHKTHHRGICATAGGGIISCCNGRIRMFDGNVANGDERVLAEANYDLAINTMLFTDNPTRRNERSSCCFMDIVGDRLVMSDLQKHVISLWQVVDAGPNRAADIKFVCATDVAVTKEARGKVNLRPSQIPLGKCAYVSGIRLDAEGWVICADADGRTLQIFDDKLRFVTRVETSSPNQLPYVSGLYVEAGGHVMVCDRKSEMGGLRVYTLESVDDDKKPATSASATAAGFAAAARLQPGGRRF